MMRRYLAVAVLVVAGWLAGVSGAAGQSAMLNLPRVSQHAEVMQRVGITDITIDYARPLAHGRKIFGGLAPYGKMWRAGANENTTIAFSDPVTINGQALAKGTYGVHMIPGESSWIVIFSRNWTSWGSFTYDQAEDALRITVKPQTIPDQDVLSYAIDDPTLTSAVVTMRWEKVAVSFTVGVNTPEVVAVSLRNQLRGRAQFEWEPWSEAATYLLENHLSAEEALKYAQTSIDNEDRFENEYVKARVLTALGRKDEAKAARDRAIQMGTQLQIQSYGRGLQTQGHYEEALDLFRDNIKKDPNSWIAHNEAARIAVAQGDYDTALKEMKLALSVAPETFRGQINRLITQLENKVDINK
jgi:tetratricopeptide (TPR) repeat protein